MTTNLANGSIEDIKNIKSVIIGKFNLLQNNLEKLQKKGNIYIDTRYGWEQLKQGYIYFNTFDKNNNNVVSVLNNLIAENIYKRNFIILKIESHNLTNSVYFYLNSTLNTINNKNSVIEFLVVKPDFIDYQGSPNINDTYTMSYILKNPSQQTNIEELPLLSNKIIPSLKSAAFIPQKKDIYKEKKKIKIKINKPKYSHLCHKMNTTLLIIIFIVITCIVIIINQIKNK
jgi:hypothetical protein